MKKLVTLIMLFTFTISSIFAEEIPWKMQNNSDSNPSNNIKIIQKGNSIKVNVSNKDTAKEENSYESSAQQNCNGRIDVVKVNNSPKKKLISSEKIDPVAGSIIASVGLLSIAAVLIADPYVVKINGKKYYMVRNREDNQYSVDDILGYDDSKSDLFDDMINLNSDEDTTKITNEELKKAKIRFVLLTNNKLQLDDKSKDYSIENIEYIDLTTLRGTVNNGKIGSFGYFDMYVKDNDKTKKIIGFVTFDDNETLNDMIMR